jgi:O-antigen ligase
MLTTTNLSPAQRLRRSFVTNSFINLRILIIAGVLGLSLLLPLAASSDQLLLVVGGIVALGGVLLLLYEPCLGFLAMVVTGLIIPSPNLPGNINFAVLLTGGLLGLWLLDMVVRQRSIRFVNSRPVRPLFFLIVVATLAFFYGQLPWFRAAQQAPLDAQLGGLAIFVFSAGIFLMTAQQIRDMRWLEYLVWLFIALGTIFVFGWMVKPVGRITGQLFQLGATANAMFWTWLVALAFSQAIFNRDLRMFWRITLMGVVVITMYVAFIVNYDWKSGWMPPIAAIGAIMAGRSWKTVLVIGLLGAPLALMLSNQAVATDEYSYSTRIDAWIIVLNMAKESPLLGFGPANYYWYTPLFRIRGYAVRFNSHNQYVDIIAQTGLLGLGCFLWFMGEIGWLSWRLKNRAPTGFTQAYVYGVLGGVAGMLVAAQLVDWIFPFVYNIGFNGFRSSILAWVFLGGLVSIEQMIARQSQPALNVT